MTASSSIFRRRSLSVFGSVAIKLVSTAMIVLSIGGACAAEQIRLSIEKATELALSSDETLRQAEQMVASAEGQVLQARANAFPRISLSGRYGRNILRPSFFLPGEFMDKGPGSIKIEIGEDNDFTGSASVSQILWAAGRVAAGLEAARQYLESFRCRQKAAADYVRFAVKEAYWGAVLASEALRIEEKAYEAASEAVRIARKGFDQGVTSRFDLMRAEVELANREAPLVDARNKRDRALLELKRRCGLDAAMEVLLVDTIPAVEGSIELDSALSAMRNGSAELRALEHAVGARKEFLRIARANRYPTLALTAYYAVQTQWSNDWLPPESLIARSAAIQVGLQVPIFDGFESKGKISSARADLRSAEIELERAIRDKELAVRQAHLMLESARAALVGREESVKLAEETYRLALVRLSNGLATPLERLDAELALTAARVQLAQSRFASQMALAYLELAVGSEVFSALQR